MRRFIDEKSATNIRDWSLVNSFIYFKDGGRNKDALVTFIPKEGAKNSRLREIIYRVFPKEGLRIKTPKVHYLRKYVQLYPKIVILAPKLNYNGLFGKVYGTPC